MIKTALAATCALALMTGLTTGTAFAQAKTDGGTQRGPNSPTSANSGTSLSTGQSQPLTGYSTHTPTTGVDNITGSATGGPGRNPNGGPPITNVTPSSGAMTQAAMPATPTTLANTPAGAAPATYPKCTRRGQDRCMSTARH